MKNPIKITMVVCLFSLSACSGELPQSVSWQHIDGSKSDATVTLYYEKPLSIYDNETGRTISVIAPDNDGTEQAITACKDFGYNNAKAYPVSTKCLAYYNGTLCTLDSGTVKFQCIDK